VVCTATSGALISEAEAAHQGDLLKDVTRDGVGCPLARNIGGLGCFKLVRQMDYRAPIWPARRVRLDGEGKTKTREALAKTLRAACGLEAWLEEAKLEPAARGAHGPAS